MSESQSPQTTPEPNATAANAGTSSAQQSAAQAQQSAEQAQQSAAQAQQSAAQAQSPVAENYEFTAPEGFELDASLKKLFTDTARDLALPKDKAQKIADAGFSVVRSVADRITAAQQAQVNAWKAEAQRDAEFGGEKLNESIAIATKALNTYGNEKLNELLISSGLGNHPEVIRLFYRLGKTLSEDKVLGKGTPQPQDSGVFVYANSQHAA